MEKSQRMERNRINKVRITEIPPSGEKDRYRCPFCDTPTHVGKRENASIDGATTVCKRCKRMLLISDLVEDSTATN